MEEVKRMQMFECSKCKQIKKVYQAKDIICRNCYRKIHENKEKQKIAIARWKEKHPNYFKDYYGKNKVRYEKRIETQNTM